MYFVCSNDKSAISSNHRATFGGYNQIAQAEIFAFEGLIADELTETDGG